MAVELNECDSWHLQAVDAPAAFAKECFALAKSNACNLQSPLSSIINNLMTELWDRNFSQTEIRTAFEEAIKDMPRYTAGLERRDREPH